MFSSNDFSFIQLLEHRKIVEQLSLTAVWSLLGQLQKSRREKYTFVCRHPCQCDDHFGAFGEEREARRVRILEERAAQAGEGSDKTADRDTDWDVYDTPAVDRRDQ
mgnify:CR=1 FL=1